MPNDRKRPEPPSDLVATDLNVPPLATDPDGVPPLADDDDGEATRLDPKPVKGPYHDDDGEETKYTGTPKLAREAQRVLEESKKINARGGPPAEPMKRVHPLVALTTAFFILAALLWAISWMMSSSSTP